MYKINFKIAVRNLFKNKFYSLLNIGGLAIGLTAFVLLLLYINHEASYDKWDNELEKVYQVRERHDFFTPDNKQHWMDIVDSRIGALLTAKVPQFKYVTKVSEDWGEGFSLKTENGNPVMIKGVHDVDSLFFKVFPYKFIEGDQSTAINAPNTIVLKEKLAQQLFGKENAMGKKLKVLMWPQDPGTTVTVTGVIAEPNSPQSLNLNAVLHTGEREEDPEHAGNSNYCQVYAVAHNKLDTAVINPVLDKVYLEAKLANLKQRNITFEEEYSNNKKPGLKAVPLGDVYANPTMGVNWMSKIKSIIALSVFLLIVSVINFVNLATAQSVQRAKEVGVRKVLGGTRKQLIWQFLIESSIQTVCALFLSMILVELALPAFNQYFQMELSFWNSSQLLSTFTQLFGLFLIISLLAGFYPAWLLSNYSPVKVLKGNYERAAGGLSLRNVLVVLQFVIGITFIIGVGVMYKQTDYLYRKDLGFDRSKLINIAMSYRAEDPFVKGLKRIPGVKSVATTTQIMGNTFNVPYDFKYKDQSFSLNSVTVNMETFSTLGVRIVSGRDFSPAYKQDSVNSVVLNEAAAKLLGQQVDGKNMLGQTITTGKKNDKFQVVGIIQDYNNESFDKAVLPTVYKVTSLGGTSSTNNLLVRFDSDNYKGVMAEIQKLWRKHTPDFPMQYTSMEDAFMLLLQDAKRQMQVIVFFSVVSILLSLFGIFALSTYMAKRKTKEIAIRKILGASDFQLINLLNRTFLVWVILANLISWPIAYYFTRNWLNTFAFRIDMPILPFAIATFLSIAIALITVSIQARRAARSNPVEALKYE